MTDKKDIAICGCVDTCDCETDDCENDEHYWCGGHDEYYYLLAVEDMHNNMKNVEAMLSNGWEPCIEDIIQLIEDGWIKHVHYFSNLYNFSPTLSNCSVILQTVLNKPKSNMLKMIKYLIEDMKMNVNYEDIQLIYKTDPKIISYLLIENLIDENIL